MMDEGGLPSHHYLRSENGAIYCSKGNHGTVLRTTNDCRLQSWGESRLGAHTNLDRARKGCVYAKVGIIAAVTEGVFASNRQVDQASAETRGIQTRGSASDRGVSVRGTEIPYARASGVRPFTPLNWHIGRRISSI